jgi:hypothetical protein
VNIFHAYPGTYILLKKLPEWELFFDVYESEGKEGKIKWIDSEAWRIAL